MRIAIEVLGGEEEVRARDALLPYLQSAGIEGEVSLAEATARVVLVCRADEAAMERVRSLSECGRNRVIVVATQRHAMESPGPWRMLAAGASDVTQWDEPGRVAAGIAARVSRWKAVDDCLGSPLVVESAIGRSPAWIAALRRAIEAALFTRSSILLTGESGTGKELLARLIHSLDRRKERKELVVLDCTTITPTLSGSEFFGHERGAFTGAVAARDGAFGLADGGTLFLDEVGELPLELQAQLLRVVQEGTYRRVGGNTWHETDFRLVAATNRELSALVTEGRFRRDLFYRLAAVTIRLPALRERPEDILPLARYFLRESEAPVQFDEALAHYLQAREYPGNVRDLMQLTVRLAYRHAGTGPFTVGDLAEEDRPNGEEGTLNWRGDPMDQAVRHALAAGAGLTEIGRAATEAAIRMAVASEDGNLQRAARRLGVTDRALQMRRASRRGDIPAA